MNIDFIFFKNNRKKTLKYFYSFFFGICLVICFPPFNFWPLLFPSLTFIFLKSYNAKSKKEAFFVGWFFGLSFFIFGLYWIFNSFLIREGIFIYIIPICLLLFSSLLAFFIGLITFLNCRFRSTNLIVSIAFFSIFWTFSEILRGHIFTGLPWNLLAHTLSNYNILIQICSVIGVYGLTFFIVYSVVSISVFVFEFKKKKHLFLLFSFVFIFYSIFSYGSNRLKNSNLEIFSNKLIRVVQPNIKQKDKLEFTKIEENYKKLINLGFESEFYSSKNTYESEIKAEIGSIKSELGVSEINKWTEDIIRESGGLIVFWPETALLNVEDIYKYDIFEKLKTNLNENEYLITGAFKKEKNNFYNSVALIDKNLSTNFLYDKIHLVPFGEYVPFSSFFNSLGFNFFGLKKGSFNQKKIEYKDFPSFQALICYEIIFPGKFIKKDKPAILVNFTNDAWFGSTTGPHQHFVNSIFRAIEEGRHLIRIANTGISASIDPFGRVLKKIPLNSPGYFDTEIFIAKKNDKIMNTIYSEHKNNLFFTLLIILFFLLCILKYEIDRVLKN